MQSSYKRSWPDSLGNIDTIVLNEFIIFFLPLILAAMTFSVDELFPGEILHYKTLWISVFS